MKTITFYSYKGGVGRSLALANVANRLSEFGKKVCLIDFDLEAPGLHLKFESNINPSGVNKGLVDYISDFTTSGVVPKNILDFTTTISFDQHSRTDISLIAAGNTLSKDYWRKLSCIDWKGLFYNEDSNGIDFFLNLKEQIHAQIKPDVLLIDSRTGITDISGVTMSIFADEVVLLGANNKENLEGISQVIKTLADPSNSLSNQVPKIHFVLSRIPYFAKAADKPKETIAKNTALRTINRNLLHSGLKNFSIEKVLVIHSDRELEMNEKLKISYDFNETQATYESPTGLDYLELFEEITEGIISNKEKDAFKAFMQSELMIEKALATTDKTAKIKILKSILEKDNKAVSALNHLGMTYYDMKMYNQAYDYFEKAFEIDRNSERSIIIYKAATYLQLEQFNESLELYKRALTILPDEPFILLSIALIYYHKKDYEKAIEVQKKVLDIDPESEEAWNSFGNTLRVLGKNEEAFEAIYRALEINPQSILATTTLAEIYAQQNNSREFYKNIELAFSLGMDSALFQSILKDEPIYRQFYKDDKFLSLLDKYGIEIDWTVI